jgi:hypothetical protein
MAKRQDLTGQRFGKLQVLGFHSVKRSPAGTPVTLWTVRCDCGAADKEVRYDCLVRGKTKSCGCVRRAVASGLPLSSGRARVMPSGKFIYLPKYHSKVWHQYIWNAKQRKIEWNLTEKKFSELILSPCHYCGALPANQTRGGLLYNGIDRKKSETGYHEDNVVSCCFVCNRLKRRLSYADFLTHVQRIARHLAML